MPERDAAGVPGRDNGPVSTDRRLLAGVALGAVAVAETVVRAGDTGAGLAIGVLVALCAPLPLAVARRHEVAAIAAIAVGTLHSALLYGWPLAAGVVALVAALAPAVRGRIGAARAAAAARGASREAVERTLLQSMAREERVRIARELHDVVAHHLSMISVQAEVARVATPGMPEQGAEQLQAIGDTARAALTEMRRLLGVLREEDGAASAREPQPGLEQLLALVDGARESGGTGTRLIVRGPVAALDPGLELTAYRIVQEALTNVRRHAPGAAVDVQLDFAARGLRVRVRDNGPGAHAEANGGHGLRGMRERAAAVGGELQAGPLTAGGFLVEATLPAGARGERDP